MGRKSFVLRIGPDLKKRLDERLDDEGETIDSLTAWLQEETGDMLVSRSAVGRYVYKKRSRARALAALAEMATLDQDAGQDEALDLTMELATLRIKEAKILDRLRELGVI